MPFRPVVSLPCLLLAGLLATALPLAAAPLGTAITYQGRLTDAGLPANGLYDIQVCLFDALVAGDELDCVDSDDVPVEGGLFTLELDFGPVFRGDEAWLELRVRPGEDSGGYTTLAPRQAVRAAPEALHAQQADFATSAYSAQTVANNAITTAKLANQAVTSAKVANAAIRATHIDSREVQRRVTGTCPPGSYLRGINSDGSVQCESIAIPPAVTTLADGISVMGIDIAIGADGLPLISYYDWTNRTLRLALCRNPTCSSASQQTLDDTFDAYFPNGSRTSLAIGADGLPVLSYYDPTPGRRGLKLARCSNAACTSRTRNTVDTNGDVGIGSSMLIGADGLPLIAYLDTISRDIRIARCGNAACSTVASIITLDEVRRGGPVSMAMGADGRPVIAYHTVDSRELKVAHCGNAACTDGNTIALVDDGDTGRNIDIAIGADGLPVISYRDGGSSRRLKVAHCGNVACSANNTITVVDPLPSSSSGQTSIAIGTDGLPIITYYDDVSGNLKVAHCGNAACTAGNSIGALAGTTGEANAITIGADGLPVGAYASEGLKVARCGTRFCQ